MSRRSSKGSRRRQSDFPTTAPERADWIVEKMRLLRPEYNAFPQLLAKVKGELDSSRPFINNNSSTVKRRHPILSDQSYYEHLWRDLHNGKVPPAYLAETVRITSPGAIFKDAQLDAFAKGGWDDAKITDPTLTDDERRTSPVAGPQQAVVVQPDEVTDDANSIMIKRGKGVSVGAILVHCGVDEKIAKLVCSDCMPEPWDFSSPEAFRRHCGFRHGKNHGDIHEAADYCGEPIDDSESASEAAIGSHSSKNDSSHPSCIKALDKGKGKSVDTSDSPLRRRSKRNSGSPPKDAPASKRNSTSTPVRTVNQAKPAITTVNSPLTFNTGPPLVPRSKAHPLYDLSLGGARRNTKRPRDDGRGFEHSENIYQNGLDEIESSRSKRQRDDNSDLQSQIDQVDFDSDLENGESESSTRAAPQGVVNDVDMDRDAEYNFAPEDEVLSSTPNPEMTYERDFEFVGDWAPRANNNNNVHGQAYQLEDDSNQNIIVTRALTRHNVHEFRPATSSKRESNIASAYRPRSLERMAASVLIQMKGSPARTSTVTRGNARAADRRPLLPISQNASHSASQGGSGASGPVGKVAGIPSVTGMMPNSCAVVPFQPAPVQSTPTPQSSTILDPDKRIQALATRHIGLKLILSSQETTVAELHRQLLACPEQDWDGIEEMRSAASSIIENAKRKLDVVAREIRETSCEIV